MRGGDLLHRLQRERFLSVDSSKYHFRQLAQAVKYLHDRNITHRDIKLGIKLVNKLSPKSSILTFFLF